MRRSTADDLHIVSRRCKIAELLLRGVTNQLEIAKQLGMEENQRSTVSRDIGAIKEQWKAAAVRDLDEALGKELDRIDLLEKEAWAAWERSKVERESTTLETTTSSNASRNAAGGEKAEQEASNIEKTASVGRSKLGVKKERRDGNPSFMEMILKCIARRCKLLGLDSPLKIAPTTPDGSTPWTPALKDLSDDELMVLEKLAQRMGQVSRGDGENRN